jgi:hypothetical protein
MSSRTDLWNGEERRLSNDERLLELEIRMEQIMKSQSNIETLLSQQAEKLTKISSRQYALKNFIKGVTATCGIGWALFTYYKDKQ